MAAASRIPIINGLSDAHHPCQALADILTLKEKFGSLKDLKFAYIGDGNNVLHSLLLLLPFLGATVSYACPRGYEPNGFVVRRAKKRAMESSGAILPCATPQEAVRGANAVYTDVWTSMGFEDRKKDREKAFSGYQLNAKLMSLANPAAIAMHCLPMIREREITTEVADGPASELFNQSENRLHSQKALLIGLLNHE
jgi:ornithine carbamoyltransferase